MTDIRPDVPGLPDVVPGRMVNEFVYCPRLFHLEWVQSRFATSDDVEEGLYEHRVVDSPVGDLPDVDTLEPSTRRATSVWLNSKDLGLAAKIDLVEASTSGTVVPVDYKKGHPHPSGGPWPSDRMQSTLQALLLIEAGYACTTAEIWYGETRQRVVVPIDDGVLAEARRTLAEVWKVAAEPTPPPPLVDSPKCPKCSLVGICLPDETNALLSRQQEQKTPRRLIPAASDARPVYVQEQGSVVGVRRGRLEVFADREVLASYRLIDVSQVCLRGNVSVSPQAMRELLAREVPVAWFSYGGWFSGIATGLPGKNVDLRRAQSRASEAAALEIARCMIEGKIKNSRTLLRRNARTDVSSVIDSLAALALKTRSAPSAASLLGFEGTAARLYFGKLTTMVSADARVSVERFDTNGRARRPPPDPLNALLSFAYALLTKDLTTTLFTIGFDPYQGFLHRPRFGRPALALDLQRNSDQSSPKASCCRCSTMVRCGNRTSRRARAVASWKRPAGERCFVPTKGGSIKRSSIHISATESATVAPTKYKPAFLRPTSSANSLPTCLSPPGSTHGQTTLLHRI